MNLNKSIDFFNPIEIKQPIHIIGVGAIGSNIADLLVRLGIDRKIHLYDFDTVDAHNITNQRYTDYDIGKEKVVALGDMLQQINPSLQTVVHPEGYKKGMQLSGYVFLCVDDIDLRREIATEHKFNPLVKAMFDFRMRLEDAQHYAANWVYMKDKEDFINTMNFTHEEAKEATPISACGTTLSVMPTVTTICALGVANFMQLIKENKYKKVILVDVFKYWLDALPLD